MRQVMKRDGSVVAWDQGKVRAAALGALLETGEAGDGSILPEAAADRVARTVDDRFAGLAAVPTVEQVQDQVERALMSAGLPATAKAYILFREKRARSRSLADLVPDEARRLVAESSARFANPMSEFVYYRTYSRWVEYLGRRETYAETVRRYMAFMFERLEGALTSEEYGECERAILQMESMPSMRLLWSAGPAARATNVAAFNCSYVAPQCPRDFGEILYILACGTGVGFSAESRNVQLLPVVRRQRGGLAADHLVHDSKEGWAEALRCGLELWYDGQDVGFDFSLVRPEGAKLRTMGGRSSGPRYLQELLEFARGTVLRRQGRRLTNLDVHDLVCKIGDCIVAGGVRRSALISLSDLDDVAIRDAKSGPYGSWPRHRELANNSAVYDARPPSAQFMREWLALAESGSGERGIFNRGGLVDQVPRRRLKEWLRCGLIENWTPGSVPDEAVLLAQVGTNPCGEINLLHQEFCNLTEAVCREGDTQEDLRRKVRVAAILGTYQSTLTDFGYLSQGWKDNCDAERLLGVSLTGQWDCKEIMDDRGGLLRMLKNEAVMTNYKYSVRMGVGLSMAVTCGKPSGTLSQLVDAASGGHPRYAPYYIRRVRISASDPLFRMLRDQGVPHEPENNQQRETANTFVFSFPCRAPEGALCSRSVSALDQLEHWKKLKVNFTEHNPSVTIYVAEDEWVTVGEWVWRNWAIVGGLSFLPQNDHVYQQAPYEEITREQHDAMHAAMPRADYSMLVAYERDDEGQGSKEAACVSGACEI